MQVTRAERIHHDKRIKRRVSHYWAVAGRAGFMRWIPFDRQPRRLATSSRVCICSPSRALYVRNHAKIATVTSNDRKVLLRGSMNLNFNPRFEQLDVSEGGEDYDLVREIEDGLPAMEEPENVSWSEVARMTGIDKAGFTREQLAIFGNGLKIWAK